MQLNPLNQINVACIFPISFLISLYKRSTFTRIIYENMHLKLYNNNTKKTANDNSFLTLLNDILIFSLMWLLIKW